MSTRSDAATRRAQAEAIKEFNESIEAGNRTIATIHAHRNEYATETEVAQ